ncbi:MAG TPA: DUF2922 domain-containing protein [Ureibacillus sp.]|nr:DUF2922 domain-containing protein [Ureibacillus sp.]
MAQTKSVLQMNFENYEGKNVAISIVDPKDNLTAEEVQAVMELANDLKVFYKINGDKGAPAKLKGAKTIDTVTNSFDITVE